jgi:hypothetical protein
MSLSMNNAQAIFNVFQVGVSDVDFMTYDMANSAVWFANGVELGTAARPTVVFSSNIVIQGTTTLSGLTTNGLLYTGAGGIVSTAALSGLTFSGGTLTATAGGALQTNANQFGASVTLSIKDGALLTNASIRTALTLPTLTASRAATINSSGQLTNGATTAAELDFVNGVTSAIQTQFNGKQNGQTNGNQFGASTTLTIADRVSLTNLNSYGTGAVFSGHVTVASNTTAQSFIGSGTGTPYLLLSSPNGAAFALSVNTNRIVQTTNTFDFSASSAVGQGVGLHSVANGQLVWTNVNRLEVPVTGLASNVVAMKFNIWTNYINTVSNFVFSFNTNRYELKNQTNIWFTNIVEEATAVGADMTIHVHNTTAAAMNLYWPAYGAQHGYFLQTNANNPILSTTTLAAGAHGVASFTAFGTNIFATFSTWP